VKAGEIFLPAFLLNKISFIYASLHDLIAFKHLNPPLSQVILFADKAYTLTSSVFLFPI
jgi:hypothetical protein